ncbi:MAG: Rossmann-like and DUF2520 domain-containing protein [Christensenellales bacterium]
MNGMRIGFIGAGKVGSTLGSYFIERKQNVIGYCSRSYTSAQAAASGNSTEAFRDICSLASICDMIFITTPDCQIPGVWEILRQCDISGRIIIHTSGSLSSGLFTGMEETGAYGYSAHPMFAFHERTGGFKGLDNAWFTVEGDLKQLDTVKKFLEGLGNNVLVIDSSKKELYHLANVTGSNLILALLSIGFDCLKMCSPAMADALPAYMALAQSNMQNIIRSGFIAALTGPVERNDLETVKKNLEVLPREYTGVYTALSQRLLMLAREKHPDRDYGEITSYFEQIQSDF